MSVLGFYGYIGGYFYMNIDISILGFYGYINGYFYMNIDISKINKNTLKFMEILCKSLKMTLIMKHTH